MSDTIQVSAPSLRRKEVVIGKSAEEILLVVVMETMKYT